MRCNFKLSTGVIARLFISSIALVSFLCATIAEDVLADTSNYHLQSSDILTIKVHGQSGLTTKTRVTSEGYITFPLLDKVYVKGLTVSDLEELLRAELEKDYLVTAEVLVFIDAYHPRTINVIGQVKKAGRFNMPEEKDVTVIMALAMAGGYTKDAQLKGVKVMRTGEMGNQIIFVDVDYLINRSTNAEDMKKKDIVLQPDDIVIVPESFF